MKNILVLILAISLLLSSCIKKFSPEDVCSLDGDVDAWISATSIRIQKISTEASITVSDIENIYADQKNQETPSCLKTAQEYAVEAFLNQWQAAKAMDSNDLASATSYLAKSHQASIQMSKEIERLAELNEWQR